MIPYCILAIEDDNDRAFMTELFLNYERLMYQQIFKIVHNEWDTDDIMQITLEKLIDKIPKLRNLARDQLVNYIITAAKNKAFNYLRDHKRAVFSFDDCMDAQDGSEIEAQLMQKEDMAALTHIWSLLDERSRYLLEGRYILEKSDNELAADLGIKPGSIRMALTRARKSAYSLLEKELGIHN